MTKAKICSLVRLAILFLLISVPVSFVNWSAAQADTMEAVDAEGQESGVRFTYDISASTGSTGNSSYTEIALGLNTYFSDWFVWRNAGFTRMGSGYNGTFGIDTSARFELKLGDQSLGLNAFVGPGYRLAISENQAVGNQTESLSAPFVEVGAIAALGGIRIGGGVKKVLKSLIDPQKADENQYFLILSGSGSL